MQAYVVTTEKIAFSDIDIWTGNEGQATVTKCFTMKTNYCSDYMPDLLNALNLCKSKLKISLVVKKTCKRDKKAI